MRQFFEKAEVKAIASESSSTITTFETLKQQIHENKITTLTLGQLKVFDTKAKPKELKTWTGHEETVYALAVLSDGTVVSGSGDKTIKHWDPKTGTCLATWREHERWVSALASLYDGTVVSGSGDKTIKHWDPKKGTCLATWRGHEGSIRDLAVLGDGTVVSGSDDKTIKHWDPKTNTCLATWEHEDRVWTLAVLADGTVVSGSDDRSTIKHWDPKTNTCLATWQGHEQGVNSLTVLGDGTVVSGSYFNILKLWNPKTGTCLATSRLDNSSLTDLIALSDGSVVIAVGGRYNNLQCWDPQTGRYLAAWHTSSAKALTVLGDGTVLSGSMNGMITCWDMKPRRTLWLIEIRDALVLLKTNRSITQLNLQDTVIDDSIIPALIDLCNTNATLTSLDLRMTAITPTGLSKLSEAIKSRKPLLQLQYEETEEIKSEEKARRQKERELKEQQAKDQERLQQEAEARKSKTEQKQAEVTQPPTPAITTLETLQQQIRENKLTTIEFKQVKVLDAKVESRDKELKTWQGHTAGVSALAVLADGTVVSGSEDRTITRWDPKTGACLATWQSHGSSVSALAALSDGTVVSGSPDGVIRHWDPKTGTFLARWGGWWKGHGSKVTALVVLGDETLVSGSWDNTIKHWDSKTGTCLATWHGHKEFVNTLAVLSDGTVVSGSSDDTIKRWDPKTGTCLATWKDKYAVYALAVSKDGMVISGSIGGIKHWDPKTGKCLATWQIYYADHTPDMLSVLADGTVVSGSDKNIYDNLRHWDPKTGSCLTTLRHGDGVKALAVLTDGTLVSGSKDKTIKRWDMKPPRALLMTEIMDTLALLKTNWSTTHLNLQGTVIDDSAIPVLIKLCTDNTRLTSIDLRTTAITPSGLKKFYSATKSFKPVLQLQHDEVVKIKADEEKVHLQKERELKEQQTKEQKQLHQEEKEKEKLQMQGEAAQTPIPAPTTLESLQQQIHENKLTTLALKQVKIFDAKAEPKELNTLRGHKGGIYSLATLGNGTAVSGSADRTIKCWNPKTGTCLATWNGHEGDVLALTVLIDGTVISGSWDNMIRHWDPKTGECLATWRGGHKGWVNALAMLVDGTVVSCSQDKSIKRWDPKTGRCLNTFHDYKGHQNSICALAVLGDGGVVSGSQDKLIKRWDPKTGWCLSTWEGHNGTVSALVVLDDGTVVSGSDDKTLKHWDPNTDTCLATWQGHDDWVRALTVLGDGTVVSGSQDKTLKRWDPKNGTCLVTWQGHKDRVDALAALSDEMMVSGCGSDDKTIKCWNMKQERGLCLTEIIYALMLLKTNRSITQLNLQETVIDDSVVPALIELCISNATLNSLDLRTTAITQTGLSKLYEAIKSRQPVLQLQHERMVKIEAIQRLLKKAEQGDIAAQLDLANYYETGKDISKDLQQVSYWYKKAAEQGHDVAQQKLGEIFEKGLAGKKDYAQAYYWYQKAADQGNDKACVGLKLLKDKGYSPPSSSEFKAVSTPDKSSPTAKEIKIATKEEKNLDASFEITYEQLTFGEEIGRGGFGVVYRGTWRFNQVAIKQLLTKSLSLEALEEFNSESRIMAQLRSDHIVQFRGICVSPVYCLVMEYMPKGSLFNLLRSSESLDWIVRYRMMTEIACGLAFLHASNIFHRDLKSLNVLLDEHYRTKLCDFGLSKVKKENQSTVILGGPVGTLPWMAPELFERHATFTAKADIYSLAMTFWEIASRKIPFADASNPSLIPLWIMQGQREKIPSDAPIKISSLIHFCWHADPSKRPSAAEVVTYLRSDQSEFKSTEAGTSAFATSTIQGNLASGADSQLGSSGIFPNLVSS